MTVYKRGKSLLDYVRDRQATPEWLAFPWAAFNDRANLAIIGKAIFRATGACNSPADSASPGQALTCCSILPCCAAEGAKGIPFSRSFRMEHSQKSKDLLCHHHQKCRLPLLNQKNETRAGADTNGSVRRKHTGAEQTTLPQLLRLLGFTMHFCRCLRPIQASKKLVWNIFYLVKTNPGARDREQ